MEKIEKNFSPPEITPNRQQSLENQLSYLDFNRQDHRIFGDLLSELYCYNNYSRIDQEFFQKIDAKNNLHRYFPKSALADHLTQSGRFFDFWGIYEYQPIVKAVDNLPDHFNIFPKIEKVFQKCAYQDNKTIVSQITQVVNQSTDIPVIFEDPNLSFSNSWKIFDDNNFCSTSISSECVGCRVFLHKGTPNMISDIKQNGYPKDDIDSQPITGDVIIMNNSYTNECQAIETCLHELGHIAEDKFIFPQKIEQFKNKNIYDTEVISSLYGLKTALLMGKYNPKLAHSMMFMPTIVYNWILTGTVAP